MGRGPQHVVPSYDLQTLWVTNNAERRTDGSLTPIDPRTGKAGKAIEVDDPYNMYFTPDGNSPIVVAEARRRLDFRAPHTMALQYAIEAPKCGGINHGDLSVDGRYAIFTCEFDGAVAKIDTAQRKVLGYLKLKMPVTRFADGRKRANAFTTEICTSKIGMPQADKSGRSRSDWSPMERPCGRSRAAIRWAIPVTSNGSRQDAPSTPE